MTPLLTTLAWTLVLTLMQIGAAAVAKRLQEPPMWGAGARDHGQPAYSGIAARLVRAQGNLLETLPIFVATVLICHATGRDAGLAGVGASLYFWGRVIYVPLYAFGVPYIRTVVWLAATAGLCLLLTACLLPE